MTPSWPTVRVHCSLLYGLVSPDSPSTLGHAGCVCESVWRVDAPQNTHSLGCSFPPPQTQLIRSKAGSREKRQPAFLSPECRQ